MRSGSHRRPGLPGRRITRAHRRRCHLGHAQGKRRAKAATSLAPRKSMIPLLNQAIHARAEWLRAPPAVCFQPVTYWLREIRQEGSPGSTAAGCVSRGFAGSRPPAPKAHDLPVLPSDGRTRWLCHTLLNRRLNRLRTHPFALASWVPPAAISLHTSPSLPAILARPSRRQGAVYSQAPVPACLTRLFVAQRRLADMSSEFLRP